ncbi:mitochondrial protein Pet127-domain-containing protein [Favolaschia claudopus]|uniref:Mitochondrial protein Pet127-domain-containing protein n=1 Tax=Favolaschia claudopus TaxID=2862362 RepID=A0AAW0DBM1_9AGAR
MKRGVVNTGSCLYRTRRITNSAGLSTAVSRKTVPQEKPARASLAERLRRQQLSNSSSGPILSSSEEVINRNQAKTNHLLRSLHDAAASSSYGSEGQVTGNGQPGWQPENWKEDWGSDASKKRAPIAYTRKIEGLLDPSEKTALEDVALTSEHKPIATLEHGLERVLFNPGVHWLQDPRSRVYNFPPHLENIPRVTDFAFERLPGFISSSRDEDLRGLAKRENRLFAGSTSSLTGMLSHCYFLISEHKPVNITSLSQHFSQEEKNFTPGQRMPTSVIFNYKDGVYAIDSDSEDSSKNVLTWLGTLLEKFMTMSPTEFSTYLRSSPNPASEGEDPMREAYRYAKSDKFVMRSQLDCVDRRLPGTGVFDIKTRACLPVRLDILNWEENSGYVIKSAHGLMESFEREYYDLIRSAFLKYGFQVRIGNMDGVIVAYHNTARMFGFQYVSLQEMDQCLFGSENGVGDRVFQKCVSLLECIAPEVIQCFPNQSVKCTFECEEGSKELNVFVQPADWVPTADNLDPPMRQLSIRAQNFLDDSPVGGSRAINGSSTMPWTLHWSLAHLSDNQEEVRRNFDQCMERKFRAYSLPTGVSFESLPQYWNELNFGNEPKPEVEQPEDQPILPEDFDYKKFRLPDERTQILRDLARSGRMFSEMLEKQEAGRKKVVLGEPYDISDNEIETYTTEEDRYSYEEDAAPSVVGMPEDQLELSTPLDMVDAEPSPGVDLKSVFDADSLDNAVDSTDEMAALQTPPSDSSLDEPRRLKPRWSRLDSSPLLLSPLLIRSRKIRQPPPETPRQV